MSDVISFAIQNDGKKSALQNLLNGAELGATRWGVDARLAKPSGHGGQSRVRRHFMSHFEAGSRDYVRAMGMSRSSVV
jgi:hypothetical protein